MIARLLEMAVSLSTCLQGGRLRMGVPMIFACVPLTRGSVIASSLPTVPPLEQPRTLLPLTEVTPSLRFSTKIYKKTRNPDPTKLKLKSGKKVSDRNFLVQDDVYNGQGASVKEYGHNDVLLRKRA